MDFERLARDAERCATFRERRSALLAAVGEALGVDSGHMIDPPGCEALDLESRAAMHGVASSYSRHYLENRRRYDAGIARLLLAMKEQPVLDTDVYSAAERARLPLYVDVLAPQGTRSILASVVWHRGRAVAQIVLKRHGRTTPFRREHVTKLAALAPAIALADVGFRWCDERPEDVRPRLETLTQREGQVARLAAEGLSNRAIGVVLGTSGETVKKQLESVLGKLGLANRVELAAFYARHGAS